MFILLCLIYLQYVVQPDTEYVLSNYLWDKYKNNYIFKEVFPISFNWYVHKQKTKSNHQNTLVFWYIEMVESSVGHFLLPLIPQVTTNPLKIYVVLTFLSFIF